ncbi:MAG: hypothetical protein ABSA71_11685 [Desulfomonilia bacterium]|jgi:hypothetical protein
MMKIPNRKNILRLIAALFAVILIPLSYAHADTIWEGSPKAIQGSIMYVGKHYIVVAEKKVTIVDTTIAGKKLKTLITDNYGNEYDMGKLQKGTIVFAKCYENDAIQKDGFVAAEIHIVSHILGAADTKVYKKLMAPK